MAQFKTQKFTFFAPRTVIFYKKSAQEYCKVRKSAYLCTRQMKGHGSVAQLNRASDYGSEGYRFESCRSHKESSNTLFFLYINHNKKGL